MSRVQVQEIGFHQLIYSLDSHTPVHIEMWDNFLKNSSPGDTLTFEFLEWPGYGNYPGKRNIAQNSYQCRAL